MHDSFLVVYLYDYDLNTLTMYSCLNLGQPNSDPDQNDAIDRALKHLYPKSVLLSDGSIQPNGGIVWDGNFFRDGFSNLQNYHVSFMVTSHDKIVPFIQNADESEIVTYLTLEEYTKSWMGDTIDTRSPF